MTDFAKRNVLDNRQGEWVQEGLQAVTRCPVCASVQRRMELSGVTDTTYGAAPGSWCLYRCLQCGCAYLDPQPTRDTLPLAYRNYYTHVAELKPSLARPVELFRRMIGNSIRNREFRGKFQPAMPLGWMMAGILKSQARSVRMEGRGLGTSREAGALLDVGCGNGKFLDFARALGWKGYGVELDAAAREVVKKKGFDLIGTQVEDLTGRYDGFFDVITLSHVIEHVYDPIGLLRACRGLLKRDGSIWLETPNIDSEGYRRFGQFWRGLEIPRHLIVFGATSLRLAMSQAGLKRIEILTPRDVTSTMFSLSMGMREGRIVEVQSGPLSAGGKSKVRAGVKAARSIVRREPQRSEFLTVTAYRDEV
jgi:2-polyprenyl-3-methyl-5-hydroxy-6-metoxy-1,4-benzoquinol methylase